MRIPEDLRGQILFFIDQHGPEHQELRVPIGGQKSLPDNVRAQVKSAVKEAGWQFWRFSHTKCKESYGFRKFVIIRKDQTLNTPRAN